MNHVTLATPITRGETTIAEVAVREPKAGEMRGLNQSEVYSMKTDTMIKLLPRITEPALTPDELADMPMSDFGNLSLTVVKFLGNARGLEMPIHET
ncbi:MAG: phage tail assembly protein [Pseudomonadota bacterium]